MSPLQKDLFKFLSKERSNFVYLKRKMGYKVSPVAMENHLDDFVTVEKRILLHWKRLVLGNFVANSCCISPSVSPRHVVVECKSLAA